MKTLLMEMKFFKSCNFTVIFFFPEVVFTSMPCASMPLAPSPFSTSPTLMRHPAGNTHFCPGDETCPSHTIKKKKKKNPKNPKKKTKTHKAKKKNKKKKKKKKKRRA